MHVRPLKQTAIFIRGTVACLSLVVKPEGQDSYTLQFFFGCENFLEAISKYLKICVSQKDSARDPFASQGARRQREAREESQRDKDKERRAKTQKGTDRQTARERKKRGQRHGKGQRERRTDSERGRERERENDSSNSLIHYLGTL